MTLPIMTWVQFALCMTLIGLAGTRLIREGENFAALTGMSQSWVGVILLATVTSLPELVTGVSAVTLAQAPDLAAGDAIGSTVVNLALLGLVEVLNRRSPVFAVATPAHRISAGFGIALLAIVASALILDPRGGLPEFGHVGVGSAAIVILYGVAVRAIHRAERQAPAHVEAHASGAGALRGALVRYAIAAAVIVAAGIWLPLIGRELAEIMGWSDTLVGTLFVAVATSVPEAATTLAAVRAGALDMAVAALLGSNLFDLLILAIDDAAYRGGSLYAHVSGNHAATALVAGLMSTTVWLGLLRRPASPLLREGRWFGWLLLVLYGANLILQYSLG